MSRWCQWLVLLTALLPRTAAAGGGLDLDKWLAKPGVKLLAVEFYATWCKPCMAAVPRWKALHEKYRKQGLRLVVVAVQDPKAGCINPGWSPDEIVCDDDGALAARFGAERLPAAFLWSWQGQILSHHEHVEDVEKAVARYLAGAPRLDLEIGEVSPSARVKPAALEALLRAKLAETHKVELVATPAERAKLRELLRRSLAASTDEGQQCELGREISANSLLTARVMDSGRRPRLSLQLQAAERGCVEAATMVDWDPDQPGVSVAEAVAEILGKLRGETQLPWAARLSAPRRAAEDRPLGGGTPEFQPDLGETTLVELRSKPGGAVVFLNGKLLCQDTSKGCSKMLPRGAQKIRMEMERHLPREEEVVVKEDLRLEWALEPNAGKISVESTPPGLKVQLDGREVGVTPLLGLEVEPGRHQVKLADDCHEEAGQELTVGRGEEKRVTLAPAPRRAAVRVIPEDERGNVVRAEVWVDRERAGEAPGTITVSVCARQLEVRHASLGAFGVELKLEPRKTTELKAVLGCRGARPNRDMVKVPAGEFWYGCNARVDPFCAEEGDLPGRRIQLPAFSIDRTEVTVADYARCVEAGKCTAPRVPYHDCNWDKAGREDHPINCVDYRKATAYCEFVGKRLPTEEEWEKAARGTDGRTYSWGNQEPGPRRVANIADQASQRASDLWGYAEDYDDGFIYTSPVGCFPEGASPYGALDMMGNVWEWTSSAHDSRSRAIRGGSFQLPADSARASSRHSAEDLMDRSNLGFRCARSD